MNRDSLHKYSSGPGTLLKYCSLLAGVEILQPGLHGQAWAAARANAPGRQQQARLPRAGALVLLDAGAHHTVAPDLRQQEGKVQGVGACRMQGSSTRQVGEALCWRST